ncbi:T9SS type B sorting domain-containing protein [Emticicia aquatica]|nr:gliding motility-associated C-terminal domain-containing protein [Emticicia aquatica]
MLTISSTNDVSLQQKVSSTKSKIGEIVTFEVTVLNDGKSEVNGIIVKNILPQGFLVKDISASIGTTQTTNSILHWNLGTLTASKEKETLLIKGVVLDAGILYNLAEIESIVGSDIDSNPNNELFSEDDIAGASVSVPYIYCFDETIELKISAPTGFSSYQWFKDGKLIPNATTKDYTINEIGIFTFSATTTEVGFNCTTQSCSPVIVEKKPQIQVSITDIVKPKCGETSGKISLKVVNTIGSFTYSKDGTNFGADNVFTNLAAGSYLFYAKDENGCVGSIAFTLLKEDSLPTTPIITSDRLICCDKANANLQASGCNGKLTWNTGATTSAITVNTSGTYVATCTNICGVSMQSKSIEIKTATTYTPIIITDKTTICGLEKATLTASNCNGTVKWNNSTTGNQLIVSDSGTYSAVCENICGESVKSNLIIINKKIGSNTIVISGPTQPVCVGSEISLIASGCNSEITWSNGLIGTSIKTIVTKETIYTAICGRSCDFFEGTVTFNSVGGSIGSGISTKYVLTDLAGKILQINSSPTFTNLLEGSYNAIAVVYESSISGLTVGAKIENLKASCIASRENLFTVCKNSLNCDAVGSIKIGVIALPQIVITANQQTICANQPATLTASSCNGTVSWNNNQSGTSITVSSVGTYSAICANSCKSLTSNIINIGLKTDCEPSCNANVPIISASKLSICKSEEIKLSASNCSATVSWSTGQTGSSISVKPVVNSIYYAVCKTSAICVSAISNKITIKLNSVVKPTIICQDSLACLGQKVVLKAEGCEGLVIWSNGNTGTSINIVADGKTTYSAKCKNDECESLFSDSVLIAVGKPNKPFISCKNKNVCYGQKNTLVAQSCAGVVIWSNGQTGEILITEPNSTTQTYSAICQSIYGSCASEKSNEITLVTATQIAKPLTISTITNICPFNTSDLNSAILSELTSVDGQFEFHTLPSPNSLLVTNPSLVSAGNYYVFERNGQGCFSDYATIKVNKTTCEGGGIEPSVKNVDISVNISASTKIAQINDSVRYTIKIKNLSKNKATGIVIRNSLPNELEFISKSTNVFVEKGIISIKIDSLNRGDSTVFSYWTKVLFAGRITNQIELFKLNEIDTLSSNNSSQIILNEQSLFAGISKVAGEPVLIKDKIFDVPFVIYLNNLTNNTLNKIQVVDDLERTFGKGAKILNDTIKIFASTGLVVNKNYTGKGKQTTMLIDSLSSMTKGQVSRLTFTVRVDLSAATDNQFYNLAELTTNGQKDISTNGTNVDPDADGDPTNNQDPTPIKFKIEITPNQPAIGLSLTLVDTEKQDEKCYKLSYLVLVKNFGNTKLTNVSITDSLSKTFADSVSFELVGKVIAGKNSTLVINPSFDGKTDFRLTRSDSLSFLNINQQDSLFFTVKLCTTGKLGPFKNNAFANAIGNKSEVKDTSNDGLVIKIAESTPTILLLNKPANIIIPQGFSPNNDGSNDNFIITLTNDIKLESFDVYNRWGSLVYTDLTGLVTKQGWNGEANSGLRNNKEKLPSGTYFYAIKLKSEQEFKVGFIELVR